MSSTEGQERSTLRGDIEGMRAVAVLMVLLYHARIPGISGGFAGVDVFFVISGFLITSLLVREVHRRGTISILKFYARRARRLLPAATLVLIVTGVLGYAVLPDASRGELGGDILASTFYVVNWALAARSVDYLAEDAAPSAVQHYWSLSVEEQFYVFWPLLMIAAALLASRMGGRQFRIMGLVLGGITLSSLVWSVISTAVSPGTAYFVTTTRVWELGFGALLAFGVPRLRGLRRGAAEILALSGVAAVAVSAMFLTTSTPWPGSAALLPVLGTTAVIAAGCSAAPTVTATLLGVAPMRFIGGISYSLYLWHWPLLVFLDEVRPGTGLRGRVALLGLAVVLAYLTKILVEDPIRFRRSLTVHPGRALAWGGVGMSVSGLVAATMIVTAPTLDSDLPAWADGARALIANPRAANPQIVSDLSEALPTSGEIYPAPELATQDVPALYDDGCQVEVDDAEVATCDYGDTSSDVVVALVGDSKVGQWLPGLDVIGKQEGWLIRTYTKSACSWTDATVSFEGKPYESCSKWGDQVLDELTGPDRPLAVITSSGRGGATREGSETGSEAMVEGYVSYWTQLQEAQVGVIALADNAHPGDPVYKCVDKHPQDYSACDFPVEPGSGTSSLQAAAERLPGAQFVDLGPWLCLDKECPAVIGRVLVYRQGSHITAAYAETMAPILRSELVPAAKAARAATSG